MNPVFEELGSMPAFVERAARLLGESGTRAPGPEGSFSLVEHVWHLADLEMEGFGERIRRLRAERDPVLPDFEGDRIARERHYSARDLREGMDRFRAAREANLRALSEVTTDEWARGGTQEGYGALSLRDLPLLMVQHDRSHRDEIRALPGIEESY
jgi:DinB superfamily